MPGLSGTTLDGEPLDVPAMRDQVLVLNHFLGLVGIAMGGLRGFRARCW